MAVPASPKPASASPDAASSSRSRRRRRHLADPVGDVFENVETGDALRGEKLGRVGLVLLERCREDVARLHFLAPGALDVQDGRLQHAAERQRLFGLLLLPAGELLDRLFEIPVEILAKLRQVGAARGQDALAIGVVGERVQQVLEREVGMPPRGRLSIGNGQDDFESWAEHVKTNPWRYMTPIRAPSLHEAENRSRGPGRSPSTPWFRRPRTDTRRRGLSPACGPSS